MDFDRRTRSAWTGDLTTHDAPVPGKQTLTQGMVQMHPAIAPSTERVDAPTRTAPSSLPVPGGPRPTLQMLFGRRGPASDPDQVHAAAARGTATAATKLPHFEQIQRSFGRHDVSGVQAHVGAEAAASAQEMGAAAYATGHHVVLGASTDLHTVAHEAAHVVQQRGGVQLKGGVGEIGDAYERQADEVADAVVRGESAEGLLDPPGARSEPVGAGGPTAPTANAGAPIQGRFLKEDSSEYDPANTADQAVYQKVRDYLRAKRPAHIVEFDQMWNDASNKVPLAEWLRDQKLPGLEAIPDGPPQPNVSPTGVTVKDRDGTPVPWDYARLVRFLDEHKLMDYRELHDRRMVEKFVAVLTRSGAIHTTFENEEQLRHAFVDQIVDQYVGYDDGVIEQDVEEYEYQKFNRQKAKEERETGSDTGPALNPQMLLSTKTVERYLRGKITKRMLGQGTVTGGRTKTSESWPEVNRVAGLVKKKAAVPTGGQSLWLFRTFGTDKAKAVVSSFLDVKEAVWALAMGKDVPAHEAQQSILAKTTGLKGHFGDLFQASTYLHVGTDAKRDPNVIVGFKMIAGTEALLYSPLVMAMSGHHVDLAEDPLGKALLTVYEGGTQESGFDGLVRGYVSIKHELRGDYSLGVSDDFISRVLFLLFLEHVEIIYDPSQDSAMDDAPVLPAETSSQGKTDEGKEDDKEKRPAPRKAERRAWPEKGKSYKYSELNDHQLETLINMAIEQDLKLALEVTQRDTRTFMVRRELEKRNVHMFRIAKNGSVLISFLKGG